MHIFRRDKEREERREVVDFFEQVRRWESSQAQPAANPQPAPPPQPPQPATQGPPPAQPAPAPAQGPAAPLQPVAQPQAAPRLAARSPFEELLELGRLLNLDLKPLEELRVFAQSLDSKIAELEREATQLENQARERRRAIELLRRLREQLRVVGV